MILDAHSGLRGKFRDLTTGQLLRWIVTADDVTGEYTAFRTDPRGGCREKYTGKTRLRFEPDHVLMALVNSAPRFTATRSIPDGACDEKRPPGSHGGNLRGNLGAKPTGSNGSVRISARNLGAVLLDVDCERYGCIHKAEWETADEERLPPRVVVRTVPAVLAASGAILVAAKATQRLYDAGRVVRTHYYCHRHYLPPGIQYPDGSVEAQELPCHNGRPQ